LENYAKKSSLNRVMSTPPKLEGGGVDRTVIVHVLLVYGMKSNPRDGGPEMAYFLRNVINGRPLRGILEAIIFLS